MERGDRARFYRSLAAKMREKANQIIFDARGHAEHIRKDADELIQRAQEIEKDTEK
jgi:hypothetical protein